jgi:hypothetical protein
VAEFESNRSWVRRVNRKRPDMTRRQCLTPTTGNAKAATPATFTLSPGTCGKSDRLTGGRGVSMRRRSEIGS